PNCPDGRGHAALHVRCAAAVNAAVNHVGGEGWVRPPVGVAFGHHVGVAFKKQTRPGWAGCPVGDDVGPSRCDFLDVHGEAETFQLLGDEPGRGFFVGARYTGFVDAADLDEPAGKAEDVLSVNGGPDPGR